MGLDVYVQMVPVKVGRTASKLVAAHLELRKAFPYEATKDMSDAEEEAWDARREQFAKALGLSDEGGMPDSGDEEPGEGDDPDELFTKAPEPEVESMYTPTYFRSSYNESGINNLFHELFGLRGFDHIFEKAEGTSEHSPYRVPDWADAAERCKDLLKRIDEFNEKYAGFRVIKVRANMFSAIQPDMLGKDALETMLGQMGLLKDVKTGTFGTATVPFMVKEGIQVFAVLPSAVRSVFNKDAPEPATWLLVKTPEGMPSIHPSYRYGVEQCLLTCQTALELPAPARSRVYLSWSA